jgi:hypothetical protein
VPVTVNVNVAGRVTVPRLTVPPEIDDIDPAVTSKTSYRSNSSFSCTTTHVVAAAANRQITPRDRSFTDDNLLIVRVAEWSTSPRSVSHRKYATTLLALFVICPDTRSQSCATSVHV